MAGPGPDYPLGIEEMEPRRWIAWVFAHPGCHGAGATRDAAVANAPDAIRARHRVFGAAGKSEAPTDPDGVVVTETHVAWSSDGDYLVNAFFEDDRRPLGADDVAEAQVVLAATREALLAAVANVEGADLDRPGADEAQGTLRGILWHVARAERWYHAKFGLEQPEGVLPDEVFACLASVRAHTLALLPALVGDERTGTFREETWSARKVLRRTIWHEEAHTRHLRRLLGRA